VSEINRRREAQTRLRKLEAEEVHTRQRYDLYRARTSPEAEPDRLKELERLSERAKSRLAEARSAG
jgi:hypothetical protein